MPATQTRFANMVSGAVTIVTTAETVVATTRAVSSPSPGSSFLVEYRGFLLVGTTANTLTVSVRRDSLAGTIVLTDTNITVVAANRYQVVFSCIDSIVGDVAGQLWVVTFQLGAATANSTTSNAVTAVTTPV